MLLCFSSCLPQEMVIGGLKPDTTYSITVAAYTTKGDGARSKPKLVVTKGAGGCRGRWSVCCSVTGHAALKETHEVYLEKTFQQPGKGFTVKHSDHDDMYGRQSAAEGGCFAQG